MGMDYQYAGSASYPRFDEELCGVAAVFGGIKSEHLKEREATIPKDSVSYWFGTISGDNSKLQKFIFPEDTDATLVRWFNDIYGDFTTEETEIVWNHIKQHPEIQKISRQIWYELESLWEFDDCWDIG